MSIKYFFYLRYIDRNRLQKQLSSLLKVDNLVAESMAGIPPFIAPCVYSTCRTAATIHFDINQENQPLGVFNVSTFNQPCDTKSGVDEIAVSAETTQVDQVNQNSQTVIFEKAVEDCVLRTLGIMETHSQIENNVDDMDFQLHQMPGNSVECETDQHVLVDSERKAGVFHLQDVSSSKNAPISITEDMQLSGDIVLNSSTLVHKQTNNESTVGAAQLQDLNAESTMTPSSDVIQNITATLEPHTFSYGPASLSPRKEGVTQNVDFSQEANSMITNDENDSVEVTSINQLRDIENYSVSFGDGSSLPFCTCQYWQQYSLPCKHMFAVFQSCPGWNFDMLSPLYRMNNVLHFDFACYSPPGDTHHGALCEKGIQTVHNRTPSMRMATVQTQKNSCNNEKIFKPMNAFLVTNSLYQSVSDLLFHLNKASFLFQDIILYKHLKGQLTDIVKASRARLMKHQSNEMFQNASLMNLQKFDTILLPNQHDHSVVNGVSINHSINKNSITTQTDPNLGHAVSIDEFDKLLEAVSQYVVTSDQTTNSTITDNLKPTKLATVKKDSRKVIVKVKPSLSLSKSASNIAQLSVPNKVCLSSPAQTSPTINCQPSPEQSIITAQRLGLKRDAAQLLLSEMTEASKGKLYSKTSILEYLPLLKRKCINPEDSLRFLAQQLISPKPEQQQSDQPNIQPETLQQVATSSTTEQHQQQMTTASTTTTGVATITTSECMNTNDAAQTECNMDFVIQLASSSAKITKTATGGTTSDLISTYPECSGNDVVEIPKP